MAMVSYNGPATLVVGDHEVEVEAHLVSNREPEHLGDWGGFLTCDPDTLFNLLGETVTVRLPNGREGTVVVLGGGKVEGGGGPPPFGD